MKKRLLITSIVMMLVVAVALSTATYAWFTSSNGVTATSLTMTAAVNSDAALEISYTNAETYGNWKTTITATSPTTMNTNGFNPAAPIITASPASLVKHDATHTGTFFEVLDWKTAKLINDHFTAAPTGGERYVWQDDSSTPKETFFLHNGSTANTITNIKMTATITAADSDAQSFIRIAVFKKIVLESTDANYAANNGKYELYGIISNGELFVKATAYAANTDYYASTAKGAEPVTGISDEATFATAVAASADKMLYTKTANTTAAVATSAFDTTTQYTSIITDQDICTSYVDLGGLGVNNNLAGGDDEMELKVVVWMDGSALNDDTAGKTKKNVTIALNFNVLAAGDPT